MVAPANIDHQYEILVTDDDAGCRESVGEALASEGYQTHLASCGEEAIEVARHRSLHLIIIDMNMPGLTGLETVTIIRRDVAGDVPSILMSAEDPHQMMLRALAAHIESFLPKPLKLGPLRHVVEEIIRRTYEGDDLD